MSNQEKFTARQKPTEEQGSFQEDCSGSSESKLMPGRFSFVCESLDGKLCLFEDADGHYAVVRTERLA